MFIVSNGDQETKQRAKEIYKAARSRTVEHAALSRLLADADPADFEYEDNVGKV